MSLHEWFEVGHGIYAMLVPGGAIYSCSGLFDAPVEGYENVTVPRRTSADSLCFVPMSLEAQEEFYMTWKKGPG